MTLAWTEVGRDVVVVHGPDAARFLQGQVSQDVERLAPGESAWSLILQPTGKVEGFARTTRDGPERFTFDTEAGAGAALVSRLQRFKLRTKADIDVIEGWRCIALRGDGAAAVAGARIGWWASPAAADLLGPDVGPPAGAEAMTPGDLERLRIEAGWPMVGHELTGDTIPAEAGLTGVAVSFTKGCYTGQELVARIDSRGGNVPRHLRHLRAADPSDPIVVGARLIAEDGKDVGWVTSSAGDIALGYVARAVEPPAALRADGVHVRVEAITPP